MLLPLLFVWNIGFCQEKPLNVVFETTFDKPDEIDNWKVSGRVKAVEKDGRHVLRIVNGQVIIKLPEAQLRGKSVTVRCKVKAKSVSTPLYGWTGVKVMLHTSLPWDDMWPQADLPVGTYDWKDAEIKSIIPFETDSVELVLGLQDVTGKLWIDSLQVFCEEEITKIELDPDLQKPFTMGGDRMRYRGVMVPTLLADSDLYELAKWNANLIRWQITSNGFSFSAEELTHKESYYRMVDLALRRGDEIIALCEKLGIKVVIDLHELPGGQYNGTSVNTLFKDKEWQDVFRKVWKQIAERYKNNSTVVGYDLANEPIEGSVPDGVMNWYQLATATAMDIRAIDKQHSIIFEGSPRGLLEALCTLRPIPVPGMVYSLHYYSPARFTLQNIDKETEYISYPGNIDGHEWNIETIRKSMQAVIRWQKKYKTHVYVGEFSAIRWAPAQSAYYYMNDCITLFEEAGWDWSYHAFREWSGWSVEYGNRRSDDKPSVEVTERKRLLLKYFSKNVQ
ncbi:MAG: cellulase family glycosylhydrolase [Bacteroidetes bacterium]|nr:cellulase family glycosylhydrolase [Bacteroidota bacterium]